MQPAVQTKSLGACLVAISSTKYIVICSFKCLFLTVTISFILVFSLVYDHSLWCYLKSYILSNWIHICSCTCACFSDPWIGLLRAQVFPHHLLQWAHEHWNEAVNVAGIVAACRLQDHQCSWKKNVGEGGFWWEKGKYNNLMRNPNVCGAR